MLKIKHIWIILILPCIVTAAEIEESRLISDFHVFIALLEELDRTNLEFRVEGKNQIYYPVSSRAEIQKIVDKVFSRFYSECGGIFYRADLHKQLIKELNDRNIPYRIVTVDEGEKVVCSSEYTSEFKEAFRAVLKSYKSNE